MHRYLLHRLLWAVPTLFGVAVLVFVLMRVVPGDPVAMMIPPGATKADVTRLYALYGLDKGMAEQFGVWLKDLTRGDFGTSISLRESVGALIASRFPATFELVFLAMIFACLSGLLLALSAVYFQGRWLQPLIDGVTGCAQAIPDFLWGLLLMLCLGVLLPWFPITGRVDPALSFEYTSNFHLTEAVLRGDFAIAFDILRHLTLPTLALALPLMASLARVLKGSLMQAMNEDYVYLARAKGYSKGRVLRRVALPNALIPTLTLTGVQFAFLVGGTVLVEHIFAYPGLGNLAIAAVIQRDLPLIQGLVLTFALLFILTNLLVDIACSALNPRARVN